MQLQVTAKENISAFNDSARNFFRLSPRISVVSSGALYLGRCTKHLSILLHLADFLNGSTFEKNKIIKKYGHWLESQISP